MGVSAGRRLAEGGGPTGRRAMAAASGTEARPRRRVTPRGRARTRAALMYPARFRYEAPKSLDDALDLLRTFGDGAKILAGGQSLIPMVKLRFATPELLVDINGLHGLGYHR